MRTAAVAFLDAPSRAVVQRLRERWDPVQARTIDPHVTLAYAVPDVGSFSTQLLCRPPFLLRLTAVARWGPPEDGVYVDVEDPGGALERLARALAPSGVVVTAHPHVTLVHERTVPDPAARDAAWDALRELRVDAAQLVERVTVIEEHEAGSWTRVREIELAR